METDVIKLLARKHDSMPSACIDRNVIPVTIEEYRFVKDRWLDQSLSELHRSGDKFIFRGCVVTPEWNGIPVKDNPDA
jgi:hypothetical protein